MLPHTELLKALHTLFTTATGPASSLITVLSGNIFAYTAPVDTPTPYMTYNVRNGTNEFTFSDTIASLLLYVNVYDHSNSIATMMNIGSATELLLDERKLTLGSGYTHVCNNLETTIGPLFPEENEIQITQIFNNRIEYTK